MEGRIRARGGHEVSSAQSDSDAKLRFDTVTPAGNAGVQGARMPTNKILDGGSSFRIPVRLPWQLDSGIPCRNDELSRTIYLDSSSPADRTPYVGCASTRSPLHCACSRD